MARFKKGRLPQRRAASRDPHPEVHVYVEGEVTEHSYLTQVRSLVRSQLFRLHVYRAQGVPRTLVDAASEKVRQLRKGRAKIGSWQVWGVFDVDQHPGIPEATAQARANGIELCISDPCFELWLVYHFRDYEAPVDRHEIQRVLREYCSKYARTGKDFSLASCGKEPRYQFAAVQDAIVRADRSIRRRIEEGGQMNPSTQCGRLVGTLLSFSV